MKKILAFFAAVLAVLALVVGIAGCSDKDDRYKVYVPDGAPALSVAGIYGSDKSDEFKVNAVQADLIQTFVTGESPKADFAILPVNAAVKLLGSGEKYTMLGTVTHGNLFILKKQGGEDISTADDLNKLKGKTVGIINLVNVPGLTFKLILNDNNIEYNELSEGVSVASDKVNIKDIKATQVLPNTDGYDYFVVPEPAASTKVAATQNKLSFAGSLQTLYGEGGYPQAVAVVKNKIITEDIKAVNDFIASFAVTKQWLINAETTAQAIVKAVTSFLSGDLAPTFTEQNLDLQVIENCGINFVAAKDCKAEVLAFMQKLNAVSAASWGTPQDSFFFEQ